MVSIPHQAGGAEVHLGQMTDSKFCFLGGAAGCPLTTTLCQRPQMVYSCPSVLPCHSSPKKSQRYSQSVNLNSVTSSNDFTVFRIKTKFLHHGLVSHTVFLMSPMSPHPTLPLASLHLATLAFPSPSPPGPLPVMFLWPGSSSLFPSPSKGLFVHRSQPENPLSGGSLDSQHENSFLTQLVL